MMGMFDSLIDAHGHEWQTKAFARCLDRYRIGDEIPADGPAAYQVEILGGGSPDDIDSLATIRDGVLEAVPAERDPRLPLLDYSGRVIEVAP